MWYVLNKYLCIKFVDIYICYNCINFIDEDKYKRIEIGFMLGIEVKVMILMGLRFLLSVCFLILYIYI